MNERITELAKQAGLVLAGDWGMKRWEGSRSESISDKDLESFAELIVRECVEVLSLTKDGAMKMNLSGPMLKLVEGIGKAYSTGIKEHFGVEE
jgi:hypothetical protein